MIPPPLPYPGRAEPSRAEPGRAEPSRAEPSRAEPSRAEPSRGGQAGPDGLLARSSYWIVALLAMEIRLVADSISPRQPERLEKEALTRHRLDRSWYAGCRRLSSVVSRLFSVVKRLSSTVSRQASIGSHQPSFVCHQSLVVNLQ